MTCPLPFIAYEYSNVPNQHVCRKVVIPEEKEFYFKKKKDSILRLPTERMT
jgi:hypothetical protein